MSNIKLNFQTGEGFQQIETQLDAALIQSAEAEDELQSKGTVEEMQAKLDQAQQLIRGCAEYVLGSFQNFGAAEVEEMTIKFGVSMGGEGGIPYITKGNIAGNIEIEIKCKF